MVAAADSVSVCLSKGLAAPVGSVLCGSAEFIRLARRMRKALGGGMRQAGVLAAPARLALGVMRLRLADDHARAAALAAAADALPGLRAEKPDTNIVVVWVEAGAGFDARQLSAALKARGVLANARDAASLRAVTHYMITEDAGKRAAAAFADAVAELGASGGGGAAAAAADDY